MTKRRNGLIQTIVNAVQRAMRMSAPSWAHERLVLIPTTQEKMIISIVAKMKMRKVPAQKSIVSRALASALIAGATQRGYRGMVSS